MTESAKLDELINKGFNLVEQGDLDEAIAILQMVKRKDSSKHYAKSQLMIGAIFGQNNNTKEQINAYQNIKREYSPEIYADAQFSLGIALKQEGDIEGAIKAYCNVKSEDSHEIYAKAQFNLALILEESGDIEEAIEAYNNIERKYSSEIYANAQLNLGFLLKKIGDTKGLISACQSIKRKDHPVLYAKAQFNLGITLKQERDIAGAIKAYQKIKRIDSPEIYAKAQFNLGSLLEKIGSIEKEIEAYHNIKHKDCPEAYAMAQNNLGCILREQGNIKEAINTFQNVKRHDSSKAYSYAQFGLGEIFEQQNESKKAIDCYRNSSEYFYFEANVNIKILEITNKNICRNLFEIKKLALKLINNLKISSSFRDFEFKFSHYTRTSVAWKIIKDLSAFRLGLIKNVNDPMEGLTLHNFLRQSCLLSKDLFYRNKETNSSEHVFISCFTLNHDSLNQFRLYGKENNQEASGVSLVFPSNFFDFDLDNHINTIIDLKNNKTLDSFKEKNTKKECNYKQPLNKQPLYRCIYIDPDTGYVSLAKRDKVTFYRELLAEGNNIKELSKEAEIRWNNYINKHIIKIEKSAKESLEQISAEIENLYIDIKDLLDRKELLESEKTHILETLHFILLPLQYLVKHAAFQEEQECRMIYITSLDNEKIQLDWESKQVYIEYEPEVKAYLDKIYLSPGALIYEDFFRHELDDPKNPKKKVRISSNPFRNK